MAKGVRLGNLAKRTETYNAYMADLLDRKAAVGYYNRPRPVKREVKHFRVLPGGVAKRV